MRLIFLIIVSLSSQYIFGQSASMDKLKIKLRNDFINTFGKYDIQIGKDTIRKGRDSVDYWLVEIVPKKEGIYVFKHIFQYIGSANASFDYVVHIARKGTTRFINTNLKPNYMGYDCWVGDTILIPIMIDKYTINHSFSTHTDYSFTSSDNKDQIRFSQVDFQKDWNVMNAISEFYFLGIGRHVIYHRNPNSWSVYYSAFFRAKKPGAFTLIVNELKIPVKIASKTESIKTFPFTVHGNKWDIGWDSQQNISYWLETALLREGDLLQLNFLMFDETTDHPQDVKKEIKITKSEFKNSKKGYDFWLFKK